MPGFKLSKQVSNNWLHPGIISVSNKKDIGKHPRIGIQWTEYWANEEKGIKMGLSYAILANTSQAKEACSWTSPFEGGLTSVPQSDIVGDETYLRGAGTERFRKGKVVVQISIFPDMKKSNKDSIESRNEFKDVRDDITGALISRIKAAGLDK